MTLSTRCAGAAAGLAMLCFSADGAAGIGDFLSDVGRALGKPFGGFVESLVTPALRTVDNTLVSDVDRRLGERIDEVNRTAGELLDKTDAIATERITQLDTVVADRLSQADGIMAARIAQIGVTGDHLIDHAIGKLDGTLDKNIRLAGNEARKTIDQLSQVSAKRLTQVDGILESRVNQLQGVVQQSVADVDQALERRLDQVDEISERRVGNLDVIGTRQILNLESTLTRLAGLVATLALVVLMLISVGKELWERWEKAPASQHFFIRLWSIADRKLFASMARVVVAHAAILGVSVGILLLFSRKPSSQVASREQALLAVHRTGFETSEQALDYRAALYNASQLAIIEPTTASQYDLRARKLKLIRDTLVRSAIFERPETVRNLAREIATLNQLIERETEHPDPDLLTLQCYLRWQLAPDRPSEAAAARDCRQALEMAARTNAGAGFLLEKLARHYVAIERFFPSWGAAEESPASDGPFEPLPGLEHVYSYDALVQTLDEASTSSYLALLDAQVETQKAAAELRTSRLRSGRLRGSGTRQPAATPSTAESRVVKAKGARLEAARAVVAAWQTFDARLRGDEWISGTSSELGVFLLNDAILTRALYVVAQPDTEDLPGRIKDIPDPFVRMRVVPPRVEWMRRYLGWLGDTARRLTTFEEARRFSAFEDQVIAFESAFVAFALAAAPNEEQRVRAVRAAAGLGLYVTKDGRRLPLAASLLGNEPLAVGVKEEIVSLANARRLRLL